MIALFQISLQLSRAWFYLTSGRTLAIIFGVGFAILAITLLIASRTKWGQTKPLTKCVVLSVLAHVWLLMYALGTREVLPQGDPRGTKQGIMVAFDEPSTPRLPAANSPTEEAEWDAEAEAKPWERSIPIADLPQPSLLQQMSMADEVSAPDLLPSLEPVPMPALPPMDNLAELSNEEAASDESHNHDSSSRMAGQPTQQESNATTSPILATQPNLHGASGDLQRDQGEDVTAAQMVASDYSPVLPPDNQSRTSSLPQEYQLRQAPDRLRLTSAYGADADSEAAVAAGLKWLATAQSADGSWNAKQYGGGFETNALGASRHGTGSRADTGVSGLALLAFLSAGHTHLEGEHHLVVQRGLEYLIRVQMPSGDLSGPKQVGNDLGILNARMYCHGIATLAIAEAYAMTQDQVLRPTLMKAAQYTINAQDVRGGGWRYQPGDPGDLSQFGWQAMALKSVERSGIVVPVEVQRRMRRFLDSCVAAGSRGGLATYRPGEGRPSETMTAEALACRLLLDYPLTLESQAEATRFVMAHRPGIGEVNVYFWYYATLALFQLQDDNWRVWNQAMKQSLLSSQVPNYKDQPGSWDPDNLWGGYGGRVYATAMSCLCLEVYYRYLPMYQRANLARTPVTPLNR